jgi:hypothetical protein
LPVGRHAAERPRIHARTITLYIANIAERLISLLGNLLATTTE